MKTIRVLYPDYVSGGLETYSFGAHLLAHILPANENQPLVKVEVVQPDGKEREVTDGLYAKDEVIAGIRRAAEVIEAAKPDKIITIGGNCIVSQASFDYLHGKYDKCGDYLDRCPSRRIDRAGRIPQCARHGAGVTLGAWGRVAFRSDETRNFQG